MNEIVEKLNKYGDDVSTRLYEQYKTSLILSKTNNFRGQAGDAFKAYMSISHINLSQKIINIMAEVLEAAKKVQSDFLMFEQSNRGIVGSTTMEGVKDRINGKSGQFLAIDSHANQLLSQASEFIATTNLPGDEVFQSFDEVLKNINRRRNELSEIDSRVSNNLGDLITRVSHLQRNIFELSENFRDKNGIHYSKLNKIPEQAWYSTESNGAFETMVEDDPFIHHAGVARGDEGQWVVGTSDQNYLASSGYLAGASGQFTRDGLAFDAEGEAAMAKGSIEGKTLFGYGTGEVKGKLLAADGDFHLGKDGVSVEGNVAYAKSDGKVMVGSEEFNGYASGSAEVFTADGHASFVLPLDPDDNVKVGLGGEATAASAKAEAGITIFGVESPGSEFNEVKSVLGIDGEVSA
ncbi:hypothetical protein J4G37_34100, partial [Microvirga sp. 3-52]|nr:hypothetical protein [Microvirga sp. 3-52]